MNVFLVDGTYELFRHYFAVPRALDVEGNEVGAVRGVVGSMLSLLEDGVTHIGVATDHVVESFRNRLWTGYKTGHGVEPELLQQFQPLEEALEALGLVLWKEVEYEADDALASAAVTELKFDKTLSIELLMYSRLGMSFSAPSPSFLTPTDVTLKFPIFASSSTSISLGSSGPGSRRNALNGMTGPQTESFRVEFTSSISFPSISL